MHLRFIRIPVVVAAMLLATLITWHRHAKPAAAATEPHPVLVELFTSEGCSSCPPADALLRQLNGKQIDSGQFIVGISEHVTYWNSLGWKDPYSAAAYTDRQNSYGERFRLDSVYTPQIVVNGEQQVLGSDRNAVLRAVRETDHSGEFRVHIVSATVSGNSVMATYSVHGSTPGRGAELFAALADDVVTSNVSKGENSGRTLSHVAVARSITRTGLIKDATESTVRLPLVGNAPASGLHLILFAQSAHLGPVLSVDTASVR
jgi:hypothetical protein